MSDVFNTVDQLTEVVGQNRMELLLFRLAGKKQRYGINVFKVREVVACPKLTVMPKLNPMVRGVATIRKQNISVIDLADALAAAGRRTPTARTSSSPSTAAPYRASSSQASSALST